MTDHEDVLRFWLDEIGPAGWYAGGAELDASVRERFGETWERAATGAYGGWLSSPRGALAFIVLTDQFPRNVFRSEPRAFATDGLALAGAKTAIAKGWDEKIDLPARQFFYLPLMHSENLADQDRCVRLMMTRLPGGADNLLHAKAHRDVIRRFGRFPYRNEALGRKTTTAERGFLDGGGYGTLVESMKG